MQYQDIFERLERDAVRYVVVGGVALAFHGYTRPTLDLDLAVDRAAREASRVMAALLSLGFVPTIPLPLTMLVVLPMLDPEHRRIDLIARSYVPFEELWAGSECVRAGTSVIRVASVAHLVRQKRANGRPRDILDIEELNRLTDLRAAAGAGSLSTH